MYNAAEVSRLLVERVRRGFEHWANACIYPSSMFASISQSFVHAEIQLLRLLPEK